MSSIRVERGFAWVGAQAYAFIISLGLVTPFYLKFELFALFVVWLLCVRHGFNFNVEN